MFGHLAPVRGDPPGADHGHGQVERGPFRPPDEEDGRTLGNLAENRGEGGVQPCQGHGGALIESRQLTVAIKGRPGLLDCAHILAVEARGA